MRITDHAKVRFLERVLNIDLETLFRERMIDERLLASVEKLGDGYYPSKDSTHILVVMGGQVVSVLQKGMRKRRPGPPADPAILTAFQRTDPPPEPKKRLQKNHSAAKK
jgi:hypothetical protein